MYTPVRKTAVKPPIDQEIVGWPSGYMSSGPEGVVPATALADMTNMDMGVDSLPFIRQSLTPYGKSFLGTCIGLGTFQKTLMGGTQERWEISMQVLPVNAVQTISITGTPTGGHFTLTYSGQTTGSIPYNATASQVTTALEGLSNIGTGNVACTGGSLPGMPIVVTFQGSLAATDAATMTSTDSLTGGSTPASQVVDTNNGGANKATVCTRKDGGDWIPVSGVYTFDNAAWCGFTQSNARVYVTNSVNNLSWLDIVAGTIVTSTEIDKPTTPTVTGAGLSGSTYTYFYVVTAENESGETDASSEGTVTTDTLRESWDPTTPQTATIAWSAVDGATSYNVYVGTSVDDETLLANVVGTSFTDTGASIAAITKQPPLTNGTGGPILGYLVNIIGQLFGWGDINNPANIWYDGGTSGTSGNFTVGGGGGYVAIDDGGPSIPRAVVSFRTGKGDPIPTVICSGAAGTGGVRQITFTPQTIGDLVALQPSISEANGDVGTDSPLACVTADNSIHFPTSLGFMYEGSSPNLPNVLTPVSTSDAIKPDVQKLTPSAMSGACGLFFLGRIYFALPVISSTNNQIWVLDLQSEQPRWIMPWLISAQYMQLYQDNNKITHFCVVVNGQELEFSSVAFSSDNSLPFRTRLASGPVRWDKAGISMGYIQNERFKLLNLRGDVTMNVSGPDQDGNPQQESESASADFPASNTGWGEAVWGEDDWADDPGISGATRPTTQTIPVPMKTKMSELTWDLATDTAGCGYTLGATHTQGILIPKLYAGD